MSELLEGEASDCRLDQVENPDPLLPGRRMRRRTPGWISAGAPACLAPPLPSLLSLLCASPLSGCSCSRVSKASSARRP